MFKKSHIGTDKIITRTRKLVNKVSEKRIKFAAATLIPPHNFVYHIVS